MWETSKIFPLSTVLNPTCWHPVNISDWWANPSGTDVSKWSQNLPSCLVSAWFQGWISQFMSRTVYVFFVATDSSLVDQMVKNLPAMQEMWVQSLGQENPLEKGMATHFSILAWEIPWTKEPGKLQSMGSKRVGHDERLIHTQRLFICIFKAQSIFYAKVLGSM